MKTIAFVVAAALALAAPPVVDAQYLCNGAPTMTGQCGPRFGNAGCMRAGDFCSAFGWCGSSEAHKVSDQCGGVPSPGFYKCRPMARPDNRCGRDFGNAGCNKPFDFCSVHGWCGNTDAHKASDQCGGPSPGYEIVAPAAPRYTCTGAPTMTGQCGPRFGNAGCMRAGDFCSAFGWCGSSEAHKSSDQCGGVPSPGFYKCNPMARPDNRCGREFSNAGCNKPFDFCSVHGWCGNTEAHRASDQCGGPSPGYEIVAPAAPRYTCTGAPTMTGQCGPRFGNAGCMRAGDFCSTFGWCGATDAHKNSDQCGGVPSPGFYKCRPMARSDNRCGKDFGNAGCNKPFDFCSMHGWCGNTEAHKASDQCGGPSPGYEIVVSDYKCEGAPTMTGQCGPRFGNAKCMRAGDFCSAFGWCGSSEAHKSSDQCGGVPSPGFYTCKGVPRPDNRCGRDFGNAGCAKPFDFCSVHGWCGNTDAHKATDQCGGPSPGGSNPGA